MGILIDNLHKTRYNKIYAKIIMLIKFILRNKEKEGFAKAVVEDNRFYEDLTKEVKMEMTLLEFASKVSPKVGTRICIPINPQKKIYLPSEETDWLYDQKVSNEGRKVHTFKYLNTKGGKIYLLGEPISWHLNFFGRKGMENVEEMVDHICKELIGGEGIDVKALEKSEWENLPVDMREGSYTLATKKEKEIFGVIHAGVYIIQNGSLYGDYLYTSYAGEYLFISQGVCPIVSIAVDNPKVKIIPHKSNNKKDARYDIVVA